MNVTGGPPIDLILSPLDEKILGIIGVPATNGLQNIPDTGFGIDGEQPDLPHITQHLERANAVAVTPEPPAAVPIQEGDVVACVSAPSNPFHDHTYSLLSAVGTDGAEESPVRNVAPPAAPSGAPPRPSGAPPAARRSRAPPAARPSGAPPVSRPVAPPAALTSMAAGVPRRRERKMTARQSMEQRADRAHREGQTLNNLMREMLSLQRELVESISRL